MATNWVRVASHDGHEFDAHLAVPGRGGGPGLVLLHEAGGITGYNRGVAARLAELGYVTLTPDLFWRIERNVDLERDEDMTRALELIGPTEDLLIPPDSLEKLRLTAQAMPNIEIEVYEGAGHAFDNPYAEWHAPDTAARAWERTAAFLAAHLAAPS